MSKLTLQVLFAEPGKMDYTKTFNDLKSIFTPDQEEILIPGSEIKIHNVRFQSDDSLNGFLNKNDILN